MGNPPFNLKKILFPGGGSIEDRGVVVVNIVSPKEERHRPPEVSHMNVNHHYHLHPYYHDFWCFDIIYLMLHHLYLQSHLNHCFTGFVQKYQSVVVRRQWCLIQCFHSTCSNYMKVLKILKKYMWCCQAIFYFFKFFILSNSINHGWWVMIYCSRFWNYEIL